MRTFFQWFADIEVEYGYEEGLPVILGSYLLSGELVALDEDGLDRMEVWISEHRYWDDQD